jgi:dTDP-glucose 4,6-dehydratase
MTAGAKRLLITGGAGFIGSHYVDFRLLSHPADQIVVFDKMTYAGNLANLKAAMKTKRVAFIEGDICDRERVFKAIKKYRVDRVVNFAAETHVDRSLLAPDDFVKTDVLGTQVLCEAVKHFGLARMLQISTDEVYGSRRTGAFEESDRLEPSSPYSASKAGGDLQALAYQRTYGLPIVIARSSNNFGPRQYPEKLIPLMLTNALEDQPLPVYGKGLNQRDWIYVEDNCAALDRVFEAGRPGEIYNVGTGQCRTNMEIIKALLALLGKPRSLIRYVADRPGHDFRYALDTAKIRGLGWKPRWTFADALAHTAKWYQDQRAWWEPIKAGAFKQYYQRQYQKRLA